jgi:hypothetical protein
MRDLIDIVEGELPLFEMAGLPPHETGLSFAVWVSPRGKAWHSARIKVTNPPYGANPETIYQIEPFRAVQGTQWLSASQEQELERWVSLNKQALIDFWTGRIHYAGDLNRVLVAVGDAPPGNYLEVIAALRIMTPKVLAIYWHDNKYCLFYQRFMPKAEKLNAHAKAAGIMQELSVAVLPPRTPQGILLWPRPNAS